MKAKARGYSGRGMMSASQRIRYDPGAGVAADPEETSAIVKAPQKGVVSVEIGRATFYALEALLLMGRGPNLPDERTLPALLTKVAEIWAQGVLDPDSPAAELMRKVGHLDEAPVFDDFSE
jgi:hypothetical protein